MLFEVVRLFEVEKLVLKLLFMLASGSDID